MEAKAEAKAQRQAQCASKTGMILGSQKLVEHSPKSGLEHQWVTLSGPGRCYSNTEIILLRFSCFCPSLAVPTLRMLPVLSRSGPQLGALGEQEDLARITSF